MKPWNAALSFLAIFASAPALLAQTAATTLRPDPADHWSLEFSTGALWSVGGNASPLNYVLLPQQLTLKTPAFLRLDPGPGEIILRSRTTFLAAPIVKGPESYFVGLTFSPSIEWWNDERDLCLFFSSGGGGGWMDSAGTRVQGGQGQDFNLTWFIHAGLSHHFTPHLSASAGLLYQHISNGGRDKINPGIDALGPTVGFTWTW